MPRLPLFTLFLFLTIPSVSATNQTFDDIFDILNYTVWTGDWSDLLNTQKPDKTTHTQDDLHGWLDITGFEREIECNGKKYVYGEPLSANVTQYEGLTTPTKTHHPKKEVHGLVVIEYDTWHTKWQTPRRHLWMNTVTRVTNFNRTLHVTSNETHITATLNVYMRWWYYHKVIGDFYCIRHDEYLTLTDTIEKPETYPYTIWNITGEITEHYNNITPYTTIHIPQQDSVVFTNITYNGSTALRVDMLGVIVNDSGYKRVNFIENSTFWKVDSNQSIMGAGGLDAIVYEAPINVSLLNVSISSPYETHYVTNFTVNRIYEDYKKAFPPFLLCLILPILLLFWVIYRSWKTLWEVF